MIPILKLLPGCRSWATAGCALLLMACGCGEAVKVPEGRPVKGSVILKGKPLTGVTLTIQDGDKGVGASCVVDPQGRFDSGAPLPAGRYKIAFAPTLVPLAPLPADGSPAPSLPPIPKLPPTLPRKFHQLETSDLFVDVKADGSDVEVRVPG